MPKELRFTPQLFAFLRELKANNRREWFDANKQRYLDDVRDPFQAFIVALAPRLTAIHPQLVADPKRSLFRIYRDTRFSKDKTPYKTVASAFFFLEKTGKEGPGVYLHLEPDSCFLATGLYMPDPVTRTKVTDAIARRPDEWRAVSARKELRKQFKPSGDSLARLPKQYDPAHEFAADLQRKDFILVANLTERQVCARNFLDRVEHLTQLAAPYLNFVVTAAK